MNETIWSRLGAKFEMGASRKIASQPVIVVLAHSRVRELEKVLRSLVRADGFTSYESVAVVDGNKSEVVNLLLEVLRPNHLVCIQNSLGRTSSQRINESLRTGLSLAFDNLRAPYAVVIEDDVVVGLNFFRFIEASHAKFRNNPLYRGVNGFSNFLGELNSESQEIEGVRLNYGLGWGWSVTRSLYRSIRPFLGRQEEDELIWDCAVEPYVRTGFVVNPVHSQIMNIGFDELATHTNSPQSRLLGERIRLSFERAPDNRSIGQKSLRIVNVPLVWRRDAFLFDQIGLVRKIWLLALQRFALLLFRLEHSNNALIRHYAYSLSKQSRNLALRCFSNRGREEDSRRAKRF